MAERRQPVVAAPRVVELRRRPLARLDDQSFLDQTFERAVERRRPQPDRAAAALEHVLHDPVAVLLAVDERGEDVEPVAFQRQERFGRLSRHRAICISINIHMSQDAMTD